jgi:hypothetical protein
MDIETKLVVRGKTQTVSMLKTDLIELKKLKRPNESLTLALHRLIEQAAMYDAIMKAGEVATNE